MSQTYRSPLSSLVAAALFALAPAIAQGPIAPASIAPGTASRPDVASLRSSAHGLTEAADGLRGFGADYGVAFTTSGMTFTPALGAQAPTDQRLQMAVIGITRGATSIPFAAVAPQQQGNAVVYARAAGLEERYEVRSEGVEQSFVFHELPGRGDLVVHCALGGELAARGELTADGEVQFVVPGLGGATIGAVTGIDARGARCTGSLRLAGGGVDLVLPAGFVDHATLPLVLDPAGRHARRLRHRPHRRHRSRHCLRRYDPAVLRRLDAHQLGHQRSGLRARLPPDQRPRPHAAAR
jgi:hypothetical protein